MKKTMASMDFRHPTDVAVKRGGKERKWGHQERPLTGRLDYCKSTKRIRAEERKEESEGTVNGIRGKKPNNFILRRSVLRQEASNKWGIMCGAYVLSEKERGRTLDEPRKARESSRKKKDPSRERETLHREKRRLERWCERELIRG